MISRRILRIKIMQALYAYFKHSGETTLQKTERELIYSVQKAFDLYYYIILLLIDVVQYAESRIELARNKKIPSYEDLHPNTKFIDNGVVNQLRNNQMFNKYLEQNKLSWVNYPELIRGIYNDLIVSSIYKEYMSSTERSHKEDKSFICAILKGVVAAHEPLYQNLEEQSIFWNDEPEFIIGIIIKTIKKLKETDGENISIIPKDDNDEDMDFSKKLLRKVILNHKEYIAIIEKYSKNWEVDRIAFLDILLMEMAIAEAIEFSSIPVKVSLNEYLEIAKYYSTSKSNIFINGILDKAFAELKENKQINKQGRGLIGEL